MYLVVLDYWNGGVKIYTIKEEDRDNIESTIECFVDENHEHHLVMDELNIEFKTFNREDYDL